MATLNPFDLLDDDVDDPSLLIAAVQLKPAVPAPNKPSKPVAPPSHSVRESRNESYRGSRGGGRGGRGNGGGRGYGGDSSNDESSFPASRTPANQGASEGEFGNPSERRGYSGPRRPYRGGGRRGGFSNGEVDEEGRPRRAFERRSGTGRGNEVKREGSGRGNWGSHTDESAQTAEEVVSETEKNSSSVKPAGEEDATDGKESPAVVIEEKEPEDKEMTLDEYVKVLEEKRKALEVLKTEERKVDVKEFESMQPLSSKKDNDEIFAKLGSDKDKRKEAFEKEKSKKSVSINEFLKPAEGEKYYNPGGRGRGGRGRGGFRGGYSGNASTNVPAPAIADPGQFPTLGGK